MNRRGSSARVWLLVIGSGAGGMLMMLLFGVGLIALGVIWGGPVEPPPIDLGRLGADGPGEDFAAPAANRRILLADGTRLDESEVARALNREGHAESWASFNWMVGGAPVTTIAPGIDRRHHFANAFLVGYSPYPDVPTWVPLFALAQRKHYVTDDVQYPGMPEVWQTSREAFFYENGDCEDHAIALADWLIGLGHDARVVLGSVDAGGHAWVVLIDGGNTYLLEATDKGRNSSRALPLAQTMTQYRPEAMFDRENYWINTGPAATTDYTGAQWQRVSSFGRDAAPPPPAERERRREPEGSPAEKRIRR